MNAGIIFAIGCALIALAYGSLSIGWILKQPEGNERMRDIAAAVRQGAQAYLNRQYMTIGIVGLVLFVIIGLVPASRLGDRARLPDRRGALRRRRLHWHERIGARERAYRRGRAQGIERGARNRFPRRGR